MTVGMTGWAVAFGLWLIVLLVYGRQGEPVQKALAWPVILLVSLGADMLATWRENER